MSTTSESPNHNGHAPLYGTEKAAKANSLIRDKENTAFRDQTDAEHLAIKAEIDHAVFQYARTAERQGVEIISDENGLSCPIEIAAHRSKMKLFQIGEIACYSGSFSLLIWQLFSTLDYPWWQILIAVTGTFLIVAAFLPTLIENIFDVDQKQPASIYPVKRAVTIGAACGFAGLIMFSVTRGSAETTGLSVQLYNASLPIAELSFALCGACCNVLKRFYSWSRVAAQEFKRLTKLANEKQAKVVELSAKISTNQAQNQTSSPVVQESKSDTSH